MKLVWNGRAYRPVGNYIKVKDQSIDELMKPLSQKTKLGSAVLTGYVINAKPNPEGGDTPVVSPSPTMTATNTPTPTLTPSSTPYILPETPALWYDATNVGSIDYITSGGTDYVANWRSIGVYQKTLSAVTINNSPVWSGSSQMPGSPNVVRFVGSTSSGTTKYLAQRFETTEIPQSGGTYFIVMASPSGATYANSPSSTFGFVGRLISGDTTTGYFQTPAQNLLLQQFGVNNTAVFNQTKQGVTSNNTFQYTGTNLNNKFLLAATMPFPTGNLELELNQSGFTSSVLFTGSTANTFNQFIIGTIYTSGGTIQTNQVNNCELGEYMFFNRVLSQAEIEQVQDYLRDKWRYDEWASPVPTPTPTDTPSVTPTPSVSPTTTTTPTPSATTPAFSPSSISELRTWYDANDATSITKRTGTDFIEIWRDKSGNNYHLTQSTASSQPLFTGGTSVASWSGNTYVYFDGGDFVSRTTGTSFSDSGFTYFYVARVANTETNDLIFNYTDQAPPVYVGKYRAYQGTAALPNNRALLFGADNNAFSFYFSSPADTVGGKNNYHLGFVSGTTAGAFSGSVNDITYSDSGSAGTIPDTVAAISLGANNDGDAPLLGYIAEVIVYGKVLTTTEKNNVETYLKTKWGYNTW